MDQDQHRTMAAENTDNLGEGKQLFKNSNEHAQRLSR